MKYDYIKCGDSVELLKELPDESIDLVFTSPPYNRKRNDKYSFYDDQIIDYYDFLCKITDELIRVTKKWVIINIQKNYYNKKDVFNYFGNYADKIIEVIIWEKSNPMPASGFNVTNAYEFFIVLGERPLRSNETYTKNHITTSVNSNMPKCHKAVMKQEVAEWFITHFSDENDVVFDPFLGIGTTAIACVKYNRHYIGFDISEEYIKMAQERIQNNANQISLPTIIEADRGSDTK